jgi:integrase
MKLTDKSIAALRCKTKRYEVWDGDGFGMRVTPRGIKSWVWMYRFEDRARRMTLGSYPAMSLADANIALGNAKKALRDGTDPGAANVEKNRQERIAESVSDLVDDYLRLWAQPRKRSAGEDERILKKDVVPVWGRKKAKAIVRRDVVALLDGIVSRGAPIQANRTLAAIRKMFSWAVSRDIVSANPCANVGAPSEENRRDRVLSAAEVCELWKGLESPDLKMSRQVALALKLQLATAQRKGEVIAAEWAEFDVTEGNVWTIPAAKAKNRMPHRVPLSPLAISLLKEIRQAERDRVDGINKRRTRAGLPADVQPSRWLFPSPHEKSPITGPAVDHAFRKNLATLGLTDATPHDLRRTAASHMTSMGIYRLVVGKILNHAEPNVTAVYDRYGYDVEKKLALDTWGSRLGAIIAGKDGSSPGPTDQSARRSATLSGGSPRSAAPSRSL